MKKILITGAGPRGFVGSALKNGLAAGYETFAPTRQELDLTDADAVRVWLRRHPVDAIVHSAVHSAVFHGADREFENDIRMFFNLERCRGDYGKLVYFGSGAEYDRRLALENVGEEEIDRSVPQDAYGFAKYVMNRYARNSNHIANLRLFGIFGPGEYWRLKFITGLCYKAVFGLPLTVRQHCLFDFTYVDDILPVVRAAIEGQLPRRDYNVCTGKALDLVDIARIVQRLGPPGLEVRLLSDTWAPAYTACNRRLCADLPGLRFTSMETAVENLLLHFTLNKKDSDREILEGIR